MVGKSNKLTILFTNYWAHMKLLTELIYEVRSKVAGCDRHKSKSKGWVTLIMSQSEKHVAINFLLMNCNTLCNNILGETRLYL